MVGDGGRVRAYQTVMLMKNQHLMQLPRHASLHTL